MRVNDLDLYMKFQRQPRVIGTVCLYAPTNKLLIPPGIKRGAEVWICDYTESGDDVYVTVCTSSTMNRYFNGYSDDDNKKYIDSIPANKKVKVIWKDLAQ